VNTKKSTFSFKHCKFLLSAKRFLRKLKISVYSAIRIDYLT